MNQGTSLTQIQRLMALAIDVALVAVASHVLFGTYYPPSGDKGFWAYSALLAILVGSRLVTPFYVKPVDAISYAVPAVVSLLLINHWGTWSSNLHWGFSLTTGFSVLIVAMGIANIVTNSLNVPWAKDLSNRLRIILDLVGRPEFIYVPVITFAVFAFHFDSPIEMAGIFVVTIVTVLASFGGFLVRAFARLRQTFSSSKGLEKVAGEVAGFQEPGIVLIRQESGHDIEKGQTLLVADRYGPTKLVVALNHVGRQDGILMRAVTIRDGLSPHSLALIGDVPVDAAAYRVRAETLSKVFEIEQVTDSAHEKIVGLVAPDTTIEILFFEVTDNANLEAGRLVSTRVGDLMVMYQITAGLTKEEIVQQKNTYGYLRGQAQQIGLWDESQRKFVHCAWLPTLNSPVFLQQRARYAIDVDSIGHFPATDFHARLKSISDLVTHNTAILGILGIGKSMLAIELAERIMAEGIKVIALDLTDQYAQELSQFLDAESEASSMRALEAASVRDREEFSEQPDQGGSLHHLRDAIFKDLSEFLSPTDPRKLKIYNPAAFSASKQTSEPRSYQTRGVWQRSAALWAVTPVEVTQVVTEAALEVLSNQMSSTARVCLIYEEAHALVPEWTSVVNDGDRNATSATARAILQGRKFGLGCLLVTQRTANVTKTILNQCNSIFSMRTFDETGKEFLSNYIGRPYADSLSSLPERHAIFFGKASACENPVLIRLNDRGEFIDTFRAQHPIQPIRQAGRERPPEPVRPESLKDGEFDDDIPF